MKIAIIDTLGLTYDGTTLTTRGLGGSESAVILIAKELVKLGFQVDVYNNCLDAEASPGIYDGVRYIDHSQISEYGSAYDIAITSRSVYPFFANTKHRFALAAKYRVLWMHDTFCEGDEHIEAMIVQGYLDKIFTLSDFHTIYATTADHGGKRMFEVLKRHTWQTRNGAVKWIEEVDLNQKDRNHFVYNASATKGLMPLVEDIWPKVKERIPQARLTCIGGFYRFRENAEPDSQEKTVRSLMQDPKLRELDVEFTGVIPQFEIAKILANANFMIYPPSFPETYGISTLESLLYKTPIITGLFGALEETAVDLASYKINYPVEPNSLYPNINKADQVNRFVEQVVSAYNTPYLHQQKQQACDLVNDIYGWDTVALQWKQHFYQRFGKFLPVEEYRKVSNINRSVARVFGRRFSNPETITEYRSYGKQQRIVVVSPFWNSAQYIRDCVLSVAQQEYDNYIHVLIDDASTDKSINAAATAIKSLPDQLQEKFIFLKNKKNQGAIYNQLQIIDDFTEDSDIVVLLDGDDWLVNNPTIFHYINDLYHQGYEFTYGSCWSVVDNIPLIAQEYPKQIKQEKTYRQHRFNWNIPYTHLRTFRKRLINDIDVDQFITDDGWMKSGADVPLFYQLIERADPDKIYCSKEIICNYNDANPLNDYKIRASEQNVNAARSLQPTVETTDQPMTNKLILIAVPTNRYIEPDTMKSIYDLVVPEGYTTRLEFFYGYQIDQIRNLIAEWAKHYDYLLSVDSDIVLPSDTLVKMLAADRDIVSGLYIQRIPGTHTLEIYKYSNGSVVNIPASEITETGIEEIAACGFGCCLIKGQVFRNIEYPHFVYKSALKHQDTVSEDVYFCMKAKLAGFKIWADYSIRCEHIGSTKFLVDKTLMKSPQSHLDRVADADLLPRAHVDYLRSLDIKPRVVYDIGACVLHWTRRAREIWKDAEFYLFEGAESTEKYLKQSGLPYHLQVLSDQDGKVVDFYQDDENPGGNSYYVETTGLFTDQHKQKKTTVSLDTAVLANKWPWPDLIKLDIQGSELDVLRGAPQCMAHCTDVILEAQHTEYNQGAPKIDEIIEFMLLNDFQIVSNFVRTDVDGDYHFRKIKK